MYHLIRTFLTEPLVQVQMRDAGFEDRCSDARRILSKYPDRVPVIVERNARAKNSLPEIEKKKFLVPGTMLCGEFKYIIHKHITQVCSSTPPSSSVAIG
jgi:GABA(A) receptor-associated protein